MKTFSLTREELYDQVWSKPMTSLAKEYFLSDNGLRKICKNFDIPIPQVGYWQKIQYGKKVTKTKLPKTDNEQVIKINVQEGKINSFSEPSLRGVVAEKIRANTSLIFKVPERLSKPDEIIIKTQTNLEKRKITDYYGQVKGVINTDRGLPSIAVSQKNVSRSLRILDTLIKNFRALGYKINLTNEGLNIEAYDDKMSIYIREKSTAIDTTDDRGWKSRKLIANGKLAVKIGRFGTFEFADTNKSLVEDQIERILIKIETEFQEMLENKKRWQIEREKQEEIRKIEETKQKLKDDELNKFIDFYNNAHRWKKYMVLKEYFDFIKNSSKKSKKSKEIDEWVEWASKKLDWYNPTLEFEDELLEDIDKNTLKKKIKYKW